MKKLWCFALVSVVLSCNNDDDDVNVNLLDSSGMATVLFTGDVAVDGCGWVLDIDDDDYKPINLPQAYQFDGMYIISEFNELDRREPCGLNPAGLQQVQIRELPGQDAVEIYWDQSYCSDPWETGAETDLATAKAIADYLAEEKIKAYSIKFVNYPLNEEFCLACFCKSGTRIFITIDADDLDKATDLDFNMNYCTETDPLENIAWLKELKETFEQSTQAANTQITQYHYQQECVFLVDDCYQCPDALQVVYNYDQEKICEFGGTDGRNTCPDFEEEATGALRLWDGAESND